MNNEFNKNEFMLSLKNNLNIQEDNTVSAKELYSYLGLSDSNYSHWCKRNITDNAALEEGIDYEAVVYTTRSKDELENSGLRPNYGQDYLLPVEIAKELAMAARTKQGRAVRDYFVKTEKALAITIKEFNDFKQQIMDQYTALQIKQDETAKLIESRLDVLESSSVVANDEETEWAREMQPRVNALAERCMGGDTGKCMDRLIERAEELGMPDSYEELKAYYAAHHEGKRAKKILIMAQFEESRDPFERALEEKEREWGLFKQNEGQKYLEDIMEDMGTVIIPDPHEYYPEITNEELAEMYADMDKMYGEGWDQ